MIVETSIMVVVALAIYAGLVWLANEYSRRTGWQVPAGNQNTDWVLRRNLGIGLGCLATIIGTICCMVWMNGWQARFIAIGESALMAAAGTSDLRRFHLPLPLTLTGIVLAVAAAVASGMPVLVLLFALAWAMVVILLHMLASKGSMQLGDHIATVWIALTAPFNGLFAVAFGDLVNIILARVKGLRGKKVAAAGAWLILAAALSGVPPYVALMRSGLGSLPPGNMRDPVVGLKSPAPVNSLSDATHPNGAVIPEQALMRSTAIMLAYLSEWAAERTASVALAPGRSDRINAARQVASVVAQYARLAQQLAPGSETAVELSDLSTALDTYNVTGVRAASQALANERSRLVAIATITDTVQSTEQHVDLASTDITVTR